jgi:hypothetical protein
MFNYSLAPSMHHLSVVYSSLTLLLLHRILSKSSSSLFSLSLFECFVLWEEAEQTTEWIVETRREGETERLKLLTQCREENNKNANKPNDLAFAATADLITCERL